jgi:hypothetical protein
MKGYFNRDRFLEGTAMMKDELRPWTALYLKGLLYSSAF